MNNYLRNVIERIVGLRGLSKTYWLEQRSWTDLVADNAIRKLTMRRVLLVITSAVLMLNQNTVGAADWYQSGRITNVTFTDSVLIMLDTGVPTNCTGTPWGWMKIPAENKAMIAFVTGLWLRGDSASVTVVVYTTGLSDGWCIVNQIDPPN